MLLFTAVIWAIYTEPSKKSDVIHLYSNAWPHFVTAVGAIEGHLKLDVFLSAGWIFSVFHVIVASDNGGNDLKLRDLDKEHVR